MAQSATFALKAGVWFRRGRLLIVSPDSRGTACPLSGRNSTYRPVQISAAGSAFPPAIRDPHASSRAESAGGDRERSFYSQSVTILRSRSTRFPEPPLIVAFPPWLRVRISLVFAAPKPVQRSIDEFEGDLLKV